jgi:hypothetical protein
MAGFQATKHRDLVGGLEHEFLFTIQLGMSCSQLTLTPSFFRGVGRYQPPAKHSEIFFALKEWGFFHQITGGCKDRD